MARGLTAGRAPLSLNKNQDWRRARESNSAVAWLALEKQIFAPHPSDSLLKKRNVFQIWKTQRLVACSGF
jgi:hypothetical protein